MTLTSNNIERLFFMVNNLVLGIWGVEEFRFNYYDYYLDDISDEDLSEIEMDFFGGIQEKLDWVDEFPDEESRTVGWLDHEEFILWVKAEKEKYEIIKGIIKGVGDNN